jgi:hypothetical protein
MSEESTQETRCVKCGHEQGWLGSETHTCQKPLVNAYPGIQICGCSCTFPAAPETLPETDAALPLGLQWGEHQRGGGTHVEWYALCGCAYHPNPYPHVHPCSDAHKRLPTEEKAIVVAAREWAAAWGTVWGGAESATDEVNDKSKLLHDAVLTLEQEIILRRRRAFMPDYDKRLEEWLS